LNLCRNLHFEYYHSRTQEFFLEVAQEPTTEAPCADFETLKASPGKVWGGCFPLTSLLGIDQGERRNHPLPAVFGAETRFWCIWSLKEHLLWRRI